MFQARRELRSSFRSSELFCPVPSSMQGLLQAQTWLLTMLASKMLKTSRDRQGYTNLLGNLCYNFFPQWRKDFTLYLASISLVSVDALSFPSSLYTLHWRVSFFLLGNLLPGTVGGGDEELPLSTQKPSFLNKQVWRPGSSLCSLSRTCAMSAGQRWSRVTRGWCWPCFPHGQLLHKISACNWR